MHSNGGSFTSPDKPRQALTEPYYIRLLAPIQDRRNL